MQNFNVDISAPGGPLVFYAMQADSLSRFFTLTITDGGEAWDPPDGALWSVRFGAPQMPSGWYDTIKDATDATHSAVNVATGAATVATVEIAEQALSTPGQNILCVLVTDSSGYQIASWPIILSIRAVPGLTAPEVTTYYNLLTEQVTQTLQNAQAAAASATLSESWAVGGTGTREGEDTNNSEYWAQQSQAAANNRVASFNGRTGAVMPQPGDYDAADVGALALSGGEIDGNLILNQDYYVAAQEGTQGLNGYILAASIKIMRAYQDVPICFCVFRRATKTFTWLSVSFAGTADTSPSVNFFTFSGHGSASDFCITENGNSSYDIYIRKTSSYDRISISAIKTNPVYMTAIITYPGTQVSSMPSGAVTPTYYWPASALASPVNIGSASFDGTADITLDQIGAMPSTDGIYSTEQEVNTGRVWIDGKPIYRKVFSVKNTLNSEGLKVLVPNTELSPVDTMCGLYAFRFSPSDTNNNGTVPFPNVTAGFFYNIQFIKDVGRGFELFCTNLNGTTPPTTEYTFFIISEYTKA